MTWNGEDGVVELHVRSALIDVWTVSARVAAQLPKPKPYDKPIADSSQAVQLYEEMYFFH